MGLGKRACVVQGSPPSGAYVRVWRNGRRTGHQSWSKKDVGVQVPPLVCTEQQASVAELADAQGSGLCVRKGVGVQVPPLARTKQQASVAERQTQLVQAQPDFVHGGSNPFTRTHKATYAPLAQPVEQWTLNPEVEGSIPSGRTVGAGHRSAARPPPA